MEQGNEEGLNKGLNKVLNEGLNFSRRVILAKTYIQSFVRYSLTATTNGKTFLDNFQVILGRRFLNYSKAMKKCLVLYSDIFCNSIQIFNHTIECYPSRKSLTHIFRDDISYCRYG